MQTEGSRTVKLRITSLDFDAQRTAEFSEEATLADVHDFIERKFRLDDDHHYAFFLTNRAWDRKEAYYSSPSKKGDLDVFDATLASLRLRTRKKWVHLHDFGDELRHEIEVIGFGE